MITVAMKIVDAAMSAAHHYGADVFGVKAIYVNIISTFKLLKGLLHFEEVLLRFSN